MLLKQVEVVVHQLSLVLSPSKNDQLVFVEGCCAVSCPLAGPVFRVLRISVLSLVGGGVIAKQVVCDCIYLISDCAAEEDSFIIGDGCDGVAETLLGVDFRLRDLFYHIYNFWKIAGFLIFSWVL